MLKTQTPTSDSSDIRQLQLKGYQVSKVVLGQAETANYTILEGNIMILDAHIHLGHDFVFDKTQTEQDILGACEHYGITGGIVQPMIPRPYIEDTQEIHNRIHQFCIQNPGRFWGMVSMNPHFKPEDYEKEAKRCVKELGFVGIKITPIAHAAHPGSKDAFTVYEIARALDIPVMIHTGAGMPFSDPVSVIPAAEAFPDLKIILAHAGQDLLSEQALYLARTFENIYLEPSWVNILNIKNFIKTIGASKLMFSSDLISNIPVELTKYREAVKVPEQLEQIMNKTVIEVYRLKI